MALSSQWDNLNPILIAKFFEVDRKGNPTGGEEVHAPLLEAEMDLTLNWQSPFENMGAEAKAPALLAMLQSGSLQPLITALKLNGAADTTAGEAASKSKESNAFISQFEGRTGITKLNSTQIFVGMPPVKITVMALFRAWKNPKQEVNEPVDQLIQWSLPKELSEDGAVVKSLNAAQGSGDTAVEILMPSMSPTMIAMSYKGKTYSPMVIESIGYPMESPVDNSGGYIYMKVPITLGSLTAIDKNDWKKWSK